MKVRIISALGLALATFTAGSMAQGLYVGAHAGVSSIKIDCGPGEDCDESGTAYRLTAGYKFVNGFAIEAGFASFGKASQRSGTLTAEAKASGAFLGGAYELPLSDTFGLNLRAGIINMKTEISGSIPGVGSGSDSDTNAKAYVGVGLTYALGKSTRLELALDTSRAEYDNDDANVRAITLGLRQSF